MEIVGFRLAHVFGVSLFRGIYHLSIDPAHDYYENYVSSPFFCLLDFHQPFCPK